MFTIIFFITATVPVQLFGNNNKALCLCQTDIKNVRSTLKILIIIYNLVTIESNIGGISRLDNMPD